MNPILFSAAFGFLKGMVAQHDPRAEHSQLAANFAGPLFEEVFYRAIPLYTVGNRFPRGLTALHFATDHIVSESRRGLHGPMMAARFADVFLGGLLYERAFREWGILGSFAAHALHNVMCGVGYRVRRKA